MLSDFKVLLSCSLLLVCGISSVLHASSVSAAIQKPTEQADSKGDNVKDPYIWLEDVSGQKALDWVEKENVKSKAALEKLPNFKATEDRLLQILNSKDQIPFVAKYDDFYYNFWRDDKNVRGLWRRTTMDEFKKPNPNWETVIDLDKLSESEKENWVWHGAQVLKPDKDLCLVSLSRGGTDADVIREFNLKTKSFVDNGFKLPEAKSSVSWRNRDTLYVGTDFGKGSLTSSGYPRVVREWKRGTPLSDAKQIFEGKDSDVSVGAYVDHDHGEVYDFITRGTTFFTNEVYVRQGDAWVKLDKPEDADVGTYGKNIMVTLRTDWTVGGKTYKAGSLLLEPFDAYLKGERNFEVLFEPTERRSLEATGSTKNYLVLTELENVLCRPYLLKNENGKWVKTKIDAPEFATVGISSIDHDESDDYFLTVEDFLTPSSLYLGTAGSDKRELLKQLPAFFSADNVEIKQYESSSKDGTRIPYFQVSKKGMKLDGSNPTLLYGYGGFEASMLPNYDPQIGAAWLERGGVYVLANIRGGAEFGPKWHNAGRKENRQRIYDDFISVAENLIERKVTSQKHLGIQGRSNGGLLMGVMLTQRPDLFGAVHCGSPLLDMQRYNHLLAGASWMDEYGDPDKPEEWAYISKYSPYHNIKKDQKYPPILITTSTKDDRVHPGHARKMVARLEEMGQPVLYYENTEGGHGAAANKKQSAYMKTLAFEFLWDKLK